MSVQNYYGPLAQPDQESEYHTRSIRVEDHQEKAHYVQELTQEVEQTKKRKIVEEDNKKSPQEDAKKQRRKQARREQVLENARQKEQQQQQKQQKQRHILEEKRQRRLNRHQVRMQKERKEKAKREVSSVLEQYCYKYRVELTLNAIMKEAPVTASQLCTVQTDNNKDMYIRMNDTLSEEVIGKVEVVKEMMASSTSLQKRVACRLHDKRRISRNHTKQRQERESVYLKERE